MTTPRPFEKPFGSRDYLPRTVAILRRIEFDMLECMERWGYREIMTPTLEFHKTVGTASATAESELFKLLDKRGMTMVMRSDLTSPIARVVGSTLKNEPLPIRLSYHAPVFRAIEEDAGRDAEFFQTGAEFIGDGSPEADAEIIALSVACLKAAGISEPKLALGHVGFLDGLFDEMLKADPDETPEAPSNEVLDARPDARQVLTDHLLRRNHVGYRRSIEALAISEDNKSALKNVLALRGGKEICEKAQTVAGGETARAAINHLSDIWKILEAYDVSDHVLIDLAMTGDFSYYTGMTFEGYASNMGFPVCSGGRYDNLTAQFGRPAPATGFAIKTNHVLEIVEQEVHNTQYDHRPILFCYDGAHRREAFDKARTLREEEGHIVVVRCVHSEKELPPPDADDYSDVRTFITREK